MRTVLCTECCEIIVLDHDPRCYVDAGDDRDGNPVEIPVCRTCRDEEWRTRNGFSDGLYDASREAAYEAAADARREDLRDAMIDIVRPVKP